jgi:hypothetical protein
MKLYLSLVSGFLAILMWFVFSAPTPQNLILKDKDISFGIVYSTKQAESLGLDPLITYENILNKLQPERLRIIVYWDRIEKQNGIYDFNEVDFLMNKAQEENIKTTLIIGKKVPRWPECHIPDWLVNSNSKNLEKELNEYLIQVVSRYKNYSNLEFWQIENEPFYNFGNCSDNLLSVKELKNEIKLVKNLDPNHPIIITSSGEMETWLRSFIYGDKVGVSLYRRFYLSTPVFETGLIYPLNPYFYQNKAKFFENIFKKEVLLTEVQLEPWFDKSLRDIPIEEQFKEFDFEKFKESITFAEKTHTSKIYLWGVEWWYYLYLNGYPEFLNYVKENITSY